MIDMYLTSDEKEQLMKSLDSSSMNVLECDTHALSNKMGYAAVMKTLIKNAETCNIPRHIMYNINITIPVTDDIYDIVDFYRGASLAHRTFIKAFEEIAIERIEQDENN